MSKFEKLFPNYPHNEKDEVLPILKKVAEAMPELELDKKQRCLHFPSTTCFKLTLYGDEDMSLNPVFRGVLTTYCPREDTCTDYYSDVTQALKALAKLYKKHITPKSGGIRKRK